MTITSAFYAYFPVEGDNVSSGLLSQKSLCDGTAEKLLTVEGWERGRVEIHALTESESVTCFYDDQGNIVYAIAATEE